MNNVLKVIIKKLWYYIKKVLKYPFDIRKKFEHYNYIIYLIYKKTHEKSALMLRKKNHLLLNLIVFLPMFLGVLHSGYTVLINQKRYTNYYKTLTLPLTGETVIQKTFSGVKRVFLGIKHQPVKIKDFEGFFYGYVLAIIGAGIMSKHPAFKKQKEIENVLINSNKLDEDGNPWKVVWTPKALYFEAYQCDVYKFVHETKFWNSINYSPAEPQLIPEDKRKFIIPEKFELPPKIIFK